ASKLARGVLVFPALTHAPAPKERPEHLLPQCRRLMCRLILSDTSELKEPPKRPHGPLIPRSALSKPLADSSIVWRALIVPEVPCVLRHAFGKLPHLDVTVTVSDESLETPALVAP